MEPVIFKRSKSKPAQRARQVTDKDDEHAVQETAEESPSTLASKLKNKAKRAKKSKLSFGGDDEVGVSIAI